MAKVKRIMVHCTGDPANAVRDKAYFYRLFFRTYHWTHWGYHAIVYQDGSWEALQRWPARTEFGGYIDNNTMSNGCKGANSDTIHVAYVGGLTMDMRYWKDTRTAKQRESLAYLVNLLKNYYKISEVIGHRDWPNVKKACPCFDAKKEYANV